MYSNYYVNADELNNDFIDSIKKMYKGKKIEITVDEHDETAYLMKSQVNKKLLLDAIKNSESSGNLVTVTLDELEKIVNENDSI